MAYHPKYEKKFSTPFEHGLELFGGKWSSRIIGILHLKEPLRYSNFKELLPGLTDPVLSNNLKKQKRDYSHTTPLLSMLFLIAITRDLRKVIHLKGRLTFLFFCLLQMGIRYATQLISPLDNPRDN